MTLGELESHFSNAPDGTIFNYGLSDPFSWRGLYAEVAFSIEKTPMTKEEILEKINSALTKTFIGWKGGEFTYNRGTSVNFEAEPRSYTDGDYTLRIISEIEGSEYQPSIYEKLVNLAFKY